MLVTALRLLVVAAAEPDLPIPPIPPAEPPKAALAPIPDNALTAPARGDSSGITLHPTLNANPARLPGGDPVPGSLYQLEQAQRRQFIPSPGLRLSVPLGN